MSAQVTTGLQVRRSVQLTIDDQSVTVAEGETILSACRTMGKEIPTLCFGDTITPKNACTD
jgi:NADH dehydrogenase/NADH:ubiquinone oxidoreductase subunit G